MERKQNSKPTENSFQVSLTVKHGLLYDVIDTNNERVSGRDFYQLTGDRSRSKSLLAFDDWRHEVTPAIGVVSPRTGKTLWIPLPVWFTPTFRQKVFPTLRPSQPEWVAGSYARTLTSRQLHQILRSVEQYNAGKWHGEYCKHDDCPLGCGPETDSWE